MSSFTVDGTERCENTKKLRVLGGLCSCPAQVLSFLCVDFSSQVSVVIRDPNVKLSIFSFYSVNLQQHSCHIIFSSFN